MADDSFECRLCESTGTYVFACDECSRLFCEAHLPADKHHCGESLYVVELPNGSRYGFPVSGWRKSVVARTSAVNAVWGAFLSIIIASPVTLGILALTVLVFLLQVVVLYELGGTGAAGHPAEWVRLFALDPENLQYAWTWVTSVLAHANPVHLAVNGLVLAMFGPFVENRLGSRRFAGFFFLSGISAGLVMGAMAAWAGSTTPIMGASGALAALLGFLSMREPDVKVYLFFMVPLPLRTVVLVAMAASYMIPVVWGVGAFNVAHLAHASGLTIGVGYGIVQQAE